MTMAGWRPHTDQVGQTGTKIAPEIYIACGISGATQHMAGCKGAKRILAINTDREAPILPSADYAVIGDLHEVVPALSAAIRAAVGDAGEHGRSRGRAPRSSSRSRAPCSRAARTFSTGSSGSGSRSTARATSARRANEATVVLGQRKLFQRLGPGLIHAFIFWGFLVLFPTIVMALIGAVDADWTLPWLGHQGWFAFLVDLFGVLVLVGVVSAFWIRKVQRPERFEGSHLGEADLILGLIALIVMTLLLWHASLIALGLNEWPAGWSPVSNAIAGALRRRATGRGARAHLRLGARPARPRLPRLPAALEAPPHRDRGDQRLVRPHARARPARAARLRGRGRERDAVRRGHARRHDVEADARHDVLHRVRPLPGRLPRLGDRQGAVAEAADHGPPRPPLRGGAGGARRAARPTALVPNAVTDEVVWDCVTCGACVHECPVSIEHVDHIVDLRRHLVMVESRFPTEAGTMLRDVGRSSNPWGKAQVGAGGVGRRPRRARARARRPGARDPLLGRLRCVLRRACPRDRARDGDAAAAGGARRRDPRAARVLHG